MSPFLVPMMMGNRATADVSMRYGFRGPCEATVTACAAGTHSVANGARLVPTGRCDVALAGSAEAAITEIGAAGFSNMTALSTTGISMPFDVKRDGFVIGEGGAVLVLEDLIGPWPGGPTYTPKWPGRPAPPTPTTSPLRPLREPGRCPVWSRRSSTPG